MLNRAATPADLEAMQALEQQTDSAAHWSARDYDALFSPDAPKRIALVAVYIPAWQSTLPPWNYASRNGARGPRSQRLFR